MPMTMPPVILTPLDHELKAYDYVLPSELVAHRPIEGRVGSRLMVVSQQGAIEHKHFFDLPKLIPSGATLVFNRSRVFASRLIGQKSSGGQAEALVLSLHSREGLYPMLLKASGKRKIGESFLFHKQEFTLRSLSSEGYFWLESRLSDQAFKDWLNSHASIPIPPYIRDGISDEKDRQDYQTVYAEEEGSVAAPTAGLHFTAELLAELNQRGIKLAYVTLHVGIGTFRPVKCEDIREHQMHIERFQVDAQNAQIIQAADGPLIAVGTTTLRALESCWHNGAFIFPSPGQWGETQLFLYPGKRVHSIDGLITNFHLPESSLLILVSALLGRERTLELYQLAVRERYRFFSYGDAMFIRPC